MADAPLDASGEDSPGRRVTRAGWGLLLVWIGAALLLDLGWGVGLIGAGAIVLGAQVLRAVRGLSWDRFGVAAGAVLVVCGVWNAFDVSVRLVPLLCIGAGIALLLSAWGSRRARPGPEPPPGARPVSHPRS
jgi:hypothetical protein